MSAEKFCLRWNDFESNLSSAFRDLRTDKDLFDVTLSCGGESFQAHKLVLSACSDLFRDMFRRSLPLSGTHSILYLRGVHGADMKAVLDFMYHGEVSVAQEELNSFLSVAEDLKVKGLTQKQAEAAGSKVADDAAERKVTDNSYPKPNNQDYSSLTTSAPLKRPRPLKPSQSDPMPEIEELVQTVKTEPLAAPAYQQQVVTMEQMQEHTVDTYDGYTGYEDDGYQYQSQDVGQYSDGQALDTSRGAEDENFDLQDYIMKVDNFGSDRFSCTLCGKENNQKGNLVRHVESVHFPNKFTHQCKYCSQIFYAKSSLYTHISNKHKNK